MCVSDGEVADLWFDSKVKAARKEHRCESCGGVIKRGEPYGKNFCLFDGHARTEKACAACDDARLEFGYADGHLIPTPSSFPDDLEGCVDFHNDKDPWRPMLEALRQRRREARSIVPVKP